MKKHVPNNKNYIQGQYYPVNTEKYVGDINEIYFRSSWEKRFCIYCDNTRDVLKWSSETIEIPYQIVNEQVLESTRINQLQNKIYKPDFYMETVGKTAWEPNRYLIEIKPLKQVIKPEEPKKLTTKSFQRYKDDYAMWIKNMLKWEQAKVWCEKKGIVFKIITEDLIFGKKK